MRKTSSLSTWFKTFRRFLRFTINESNNASLAGKIMEDPYAGRVAQEVENGYSVHPMWEVVTDIILHRTLYTNIQTYIHRYIDT